MRAVIYRRVSAEKQTEKYSLPAQLKLCMEFCTRNGWQVVKDLVDEGYSGALFEERPAFSELLQLANLKKIDVIVVTDLDRLARPDNLVDLGRLQKILIENHIKLATISGRISDLSNSSDWFFSSLESLMAGWERKKIKERVKRAVREKKLRGYFWGPIEPSGYLWREDGMLVPNPTRIERTGKRGHKYTIFSASEVQEIFKLYLTGDTVLSIAKKMGVPDNTIAMILDRAMFYAGYILEMKEGGKVIAKGLHEPLISEFQAQKTLQLRSERFKAYQNSRERFPSMGLLKCAICGSPIVLQTTVKRRKTVRRYLKYLCGNRKFAKLRKVNPCPLPTFDVADVENKIMEMAEKIITTPENIFKMLSNSNLFLRHCHDRLLHIESELAILNQRKERLMELYEFLHTKEEIRTHKLKIEKLEKQIQSKKKEAETIQKDIRMQEAIPQKHTDILKLLEVFQEIITEANESERRKILRSLFEVILLHPNKEISYKLHIPSISQEISEKANEWKVRHFRTTVSFFSMNCPNLRRTSSR
ncbi:MAG: recombinase family protein [Desulfobacterota bacterium]|nr:recombinase family protein [Thermodesulfobacteriota bacterium]